MAKSKKKKTTLRKPVARKPEPQQPSGSLPPAASPLPNLNQPAPKLNYKIVGTPILPGPK